MANRHDHNKGLSASTTSTAAATTMASKEGPNTMAASSPVLCYNLPRHHVGASSLCASAMAGRLKCLRGVVFDMDGTLTVPVIDFRRMHREVLGDSHPRIVSGSPIDILHEIQDWPSDKQAAAYRIITDHERRALDRLQIMPGAVELCTFLDHLKLRRGLITRNVKASVDLFHSCFGMEFTPALSREFRPYKPDPAPLLHICKVWEVAPANVIMVGDCAKDDIVCGNRAGALTCLLDEVDRYDVSSLPSEEKPDFKIKSLKELLSLLKSTLD